MFPFITSKSPVGWITCDNPTPHYPFTHSFYRHPLMIPAYIIISRLQSSGLTNLSFLYIYLLSFFCKDRPSFLLHSNSMFINTRVNFLNCSVNLEPFLCPRGLSTYSLIWPLKDVKLLPPGHYFTFFTGLLVFILPDSAVTFSLAFCTKS